MGKLRVSRGKIKGSIPMIGVIDVSVEDHGSIILVRPITNAAKGWIHENVQYDAQWFGGALAVESRYLGGLIAGMRDSGLEVNF